jgi:acetylglutamate kinase
MGGRAELVSGKNVLRARKAAPHLTATGEKIDLGFVGDITEVDVEPVKKLIAAEIVPIISPLALGADAQIYNINADIAAAEIAEALRAHRMIYLSDINGVRRDPRDENSLIYTLTAVQIEQLKEEGIIAGGMLPKVNSALKALAHGVEKVHFLDGRQPQALLLELFTDGGIGTAITNGKAQP